MAVQYASFEEWQSRYGAVQLNDKAPRPADFDPETPNYDHVETWADGLLLKASREIDGYLRTGGYTAPLVNSGTEEPLTAEEDRLRDWCLTIATSLAELATLGETETSLAASNRARGELQAVSLGRIRLNASLESSIVGGSIAHVTGDVGPLGRIVQLARCAPDR